MLYNQARKCYLLAAAIATMAGLSAQNPAALVERGQSLFQRDCAFCHGRDAAGGETGPDLTRSKLVGEDAEGSMIAPVIRGGRADKGMPSFGVPN